MAVAELSPDETIVRILLEKGADRLARNASGKTPSDLAGDMGDEVIAALVK